MKYFICLLLGLILVLNIVQAAPTSISINTTREYASNTVILAFNVTGDAQGNGGAAAFYYAPITSGSNGTFVLIGYDNRTTGHFNISFDTTSVSDGTYTLLFENQSISDDAGTNATSTFIIDNTFPTITLNNPNNGEQVIPNDGLVNFYYTPNDLNFGNVTLFTSGSISARAHSDTTSPNISNNRVNSFSINFGTSGSRTWIIQVRDLAGNVINSSSRTINILLASEGGAPIVTNGGTHGGVLIAPPLKSLATSRNNNQNNIMTFIQNNAFWIIIVFIIFIIIKKKR